MGLRLFTSYALTLTLVVIFELLPSTARAQDSVSQTCAQIGFKPGTKGHTDCVNLNSGVGSRVAPKPAVPAPALKAPVVRELTAAQREDKFWDDAKAAGTIEGYEAYMAIYPGGRFVAFAKANIARLTPSAPSPAPQTITSPTPPPNLTLPGSVFKDCPDCPEMVVIPAGSFEMGSSVLSESPVHRVTLRSFSIGKTEVTQGQWRAIMGNNPSHFSNCGDNCPVDSVSWDNAKQFVSRLSANTGKTYRLSSEAEWEYACRAGERQEYCGSNSSDNAGWHKDNSGGRTKPVAGKQANAWGLHDMSGNVWEWTEDCWMDDYNGAPTDGRAWNLWLHCPQQLARGGSWINDPQLNLRAAFRKRFFVVYGTFSYGFRVARTD